MTCNFRHAEAEHSTVANMDFSTPEKTLPMLSVSNACYILEKIPASKSPFFSEWMTIHIMISQTGYLLIKWQSVIFFYIPDETDLTIAWNLQMVFNFRHIKPKEILKTKPYGPKLYNYTEHFIKKFPETVCPLWRPLLKRGLLHHYSCFCTSADTNCPGEEQILTCFIGTKGSN